MRLPVFVHQFDSGYADNGLGSDDTRLPLSEVWGKTNDGLTWMAQWDGHPAAIGSLDAVVRTERDVYAPQGIDYRPWGVVHGRWPGVADCARNEGRMAGEIARAAAGPGRRRSTSSTSSRATTLRSPRSGVTISVRVPTTCGRSSKASRARAASSSGYAPMRASRTSRLWRSRPGRATRA